jgi:hypothetical protein
VGEGRGEGAAIHHVLAQRKLSDSSTDVDGLRPIRAVSVRRVYSGEGKTSGDSQRPD